MKRGTEWVVSVQEPGDLDEQVWADLSDPEDEDDKKNTVWDLCWHSHGRKHQGHKPMHKQACEGIDPRSGNAHWQRGGMQDT